MLKLESVWKHVGILLPYQFILIIIFFIVKSFHWGWILGRNSDESLKSFALAIHSHLFKLAQPLPVSTVLLLYTVKEKGGKPDRKTIPPSLWFKKSVLKPQVRECSRLCLESSTICTFMNSASELKSTDSSHGGAVSRSLIYCSLLPCLPTDLYSG